jgi:hypothetical protein
MLALTAYDTYVEKRFDTLKRFTAALCHMDGVGLITPDFEARLSGVLRKRLAEVRATE